jgi:hypothetical protein
VRGSFTRAEISTAAATAIRASSGAQLSIISAQAGVMISPATCGVRLARATPPA